MKKHTLFMMVGVPGCGKSTWIMKYSRPTDTIVSRDKIRFKKLNEGDNNFKYEDVVFNEYVNCIQKAIDAGRGDIIADATHITKGSRLKLLNRLNLKDYVVAPIVMDTDKETCLKRNASRKGRALVPENVIEKMWKSFRCPNFSEFPYEAIFTYHDKLPDDASDKITYCVNDIYNYEDN